MKILLVALAIVVSLIVAVISARAQSFDCSNGFSNSDCDTAKVFKVVGNTTPRLEGSSLLLFPTGSNHAVSTLIYQTPVNVTKFNTSFSFVPNGLFFSFIFNNTNNVPGYQGSSFQGGAGCEADFFQGYGIGAPPNNVFAIDFDSYDPLNPMQNAPWDFTYSSVQMYQSNLTSLVYPNVYVQCPCIGGSSICGDNTNPSDGLHQVTKLSTSPVPLNSPVNTAETTTGDTYHANLSYNGSDLSLDLSDVTKGGPHYTHTWNNIDISHSVGGPTAWVGLGASSSGSSKYPLYVKSFTYSIGGDAPTPVPTATPQAGNCSFTSPVGTVTWACSPVVTLSSNVMLERTIPPKPGSLTRPTPAPTPEGDCSITMPQGKIGWSCK